MIGDIFRKMELFIFQSAAKFPSNSMKGTDLKNLTQG